MQLLYEYQINLLKNKIEKMVEQKLLVVPFYWLTAKKGKIGEIYNIGGKNTDSVENVLKKLISFSKVKIKSKINKKLLRPTDVTKQIPDCKKFKKHTKWSPRINLEESLLKLLKDIRFEFKKWEKKY